MNELVYYKQHEDSIHLKYDIATRRYNAMGYTKDTSSKTSYSIIDTLVFPLLSKGDKEHITLTWNKASYETLFRLIEEEKIEDILLK